MQRVRHTPFDRVLRRRQRLAQHLAAKDLRAADIATGSAKDIGFDALEFEQLDKVCKNRVHA